MNLRGLSETTIASRSGRRVLTYIGVQPLAVPLSELQAEKTAQLWPGTSNPADPKFLQLLHPLGVTILRAFAMIAVASARLALDRFVRSGGRY